MRSTLAGTPTSYQTTGTGTSVKSNILYKTKQVLVRRAHHEDCVVIRILRGGATKRFQRRRPYYALAGTSMH